MERKGINYDVGIEFNRDYHSRPAYDEKTVHRELEIISGDLHCNAVRISGTDPQRLMATSEDALKQGLEVWLSPHLHDRSEQETLEYTVKCAAKAEALRQRWPDLLFVTGCELTLFMEGILPGHNIFERIGNPKLIETVRTGEPGRKLNAFLARLNDAVREVFHGKVTYAACPLEFGIDWQRFDFVCLDHYREARNRDAYAAMLKPYFAHGKPVVVTEAGCCAYRGAEDMGGRGFMIVDPADPGRLNGNYVRDEGVQARELSDLLGILDTAGAGGAFVFTFVAPALPHSDDPRHDMDLASFSIVKSYVGRHGTTYPDMRWEPKEAFWAVADYYARRSEG